MSTLRIIDWNISYAGDIERKISYLKTFVTDNSCIMLQEVTPYAYEHIKNMLGKFYQMIYSLEYRKPSKFDSDARKLGVLILVSKELKIIEAGVIERSPFPDRTVYVTVKKDDKIIKLLSLHSLTGCGYYRAKSVQYDSFAEFIDTFHPDIIGIDANEPQIDHYDIRQMQFFDNGPGAKHFFDEIADIGLSDAFVCFNGTEGHEKGKPLIKSYSICRRGAVRYDFLFVKDTYIVNSLEYKYDEAITAGSDHAIIIGEIKE